MYSIDRIFSRFMPKNPAAATKQMIHGRRRNSFAISIVLVLFSGCAAGGYGRLLTDPQVTQMFETNTVPEDYRYYQTGRTDLPYAIIGIAPHYQLDSAIWESVKPNTNEFSRKVNFVWIPETWDRLEPAQGAWIVDAQGTRVGIWFSAYPRTTVQVKQDRRVVVFSPYIPVRE
jgi:hypothetical protein